MSWIESHQSLQTHRKLLRASTLLRIDKYKLIGHLHALWWWGLDNADNYGTLGDVTAAEIADAAGWPRKAADAFVDALVTCGGPGKRGFLEHDLGGYSLHNWWKYAGKLNAKREADNQRKRAGKSDGIPSEGRAEVARKSQAPNQPTNQPTLPTQPTNPPDLDREGPAHPFAVAFSHKYQEANGGRPPAPVAHAAALAIEREYGSAACIQVAEDFGWTKHPNYLAKVLEKRRHDSPARGEELSMSVEVIER